MTLCIYLSLGALIALMEWRRYSRGRQLDAMSFFNFSYFVLFVLVPINVICFGEDVVRQKYAFETYGSGDTSTALSLFFCYVLFCFGYSLKRENRQTATPSEAACFSLADSLRVAKVIFFLGVLLTAIYVVQIGGISAAVSEASEVRSGEFSIGSKYIFYRHFSQFSADAFVLFFAVLLVKKARKTKIASGDKVFLFFALLFFVYYALTTAGRRPFIYPLMLCFLIYWSMGAKLKKAAVAMLALIFIIAGLGTFFGPIVLSGNWSATFDLLDINRADWKALGEIVYDNATSGLADSYIHFVAAQKAFLWQFGFLMDIADLPRDFLPLRLFGIEKSRNAMLDATSEFILGHRLPEGMTSEEPLGLHGYLLVNFGYVGMFASFFVLGRFYRWIHNRFTPSGPKDAVGWLIYWWFVLGFFIYLRDGMLVFVLKEQLTWWLITGVLLHYAAKRQLDARGSNTGSLEIQTQDAVQGY